MVWLPDGIISLWIYLTVLTECSALQGKNKTNWQKWYS